MANKSGRTHAAMFLVVLAWLPVVSMLFRVWVHQDSVQMGYALSVQERRRDGLRARLHELEVEVAALRSPQHLTRVATRLGLQVPRAQQLIRGSLTPTGSESHLARADAIEAWHGSR